MEKTWLTMNNLIKHIFRLWYAPFLLTPAIAEEIEENFMKRWDMMLTNLHYAGGMLNPYLVLNAYYEGIWNYNRMEKQSVL